MFSYAYKLKNKFQLELEGIGNIFLVGILDPATVDDCTCTKFHSFNTKCTPTISERYDQRSVLPALCKTPWAAKKVVQMLIFTLQKKIWKRTINKLLFDYRFKCFCP